MKTKPIVITILLASASFVSTTLSAQTYSPQHQAVMKLFQGPSEKTAKDAVWTAGDMFKVGVIDNGSNRNGYASYVCEALYDYGFKGKNIRVQVVDIVKLSGKGKWVKLGEARCH